MLESWKPFISSCSNSIQLNKKQKWRNYLSFIVIQNPILTPLAIIGTVISSSAPLWTYLLTPSITTTTNSCLSKPLITTCQHHVITTSASSCPHQRHIMSTLSPIMSMSAPTMPRRTKSTVLYAYIEKCVMVKTRT